MKLVSFSAASLALVLCSQSAHADDLSPGGASRGVVTRIKKGVKEVGLASLFTASYAKTEDSKSFDLTVFGGLSFKYFVADNVGVTLEAGGLVDRSTRGLTRTDFAGYGTLSAAYYAALGGGLLLAPTLGAGGFYGGRSEGDEPTVLHSSVLGGIGRLGLGLVFYPSNRVNLFARPEAVALFGSVRPEATTALPEPPSASLLRVTGGFSVGANVVF